MATQRERILDFLRAHPEGADDDIIAARLGIPQRQSVNQICRVLEGQGIIDRRYDATEGKIVNRLRSTVTTRPDQDLVQSTAPVTAPLVAVKVVTLADGAAVRGFAYSGEILLSEDQVKGAVEAVLKADGWSVTTRWGRLAGIDIEARRDAGRLVLEAKGEGSRDQIRVNFLLGALGELLQRMDGPDATYGLAFPAHRQYAGLVLRLPGWVKSHLNPCFYLVRPTPDGGYEVGVIKTRHDAGRR